MCGIFGAIGNYNPGIIRALTLINRERGIDSLGFFGPKGSIKRAGDPLNCLCDDDFSDFIDKRSWFIAGHTRQATQGAVTDANAHPFKYGRIIGSHNGIVSAPKQYQVDSEYLIDILQNGYQALASINGFWGLSWFDGQDFYLQAYGNEIAVGRKGNVWYYSSDWVHLDACARPDRDFLILQAGATIRWNIKSRKYQTMPRLKKIVNWISWKKNDRCADEKDDDWKEVWSEYSREYD